MLSGVVDGGDAVVDVDAQVLAGVGHDSQAVDRRVEVDAEGAPLEGDAQRGDLRRRRPRCDVDRVDATGVADGVEHVVGWAVVHTDQRGVAHQPGHGGRSARRGRVRRPGSRSACRRRRARPRPGGHRGERGWAQSLAVGGGGGAQLFIGPHAPIDRALATVVTAASFVLFTWNLLHGRRGAGPPPLCVEDGSRHTGITVAAGHLTGGGPARPARTRCRPSRRTHDEVMPGDRDRVSNGEPADLGAEAGVDTKRPAARLAEDRPPSHVEHYVSTSCAPSVHRFVTCDSPQLRSKPHHPSSDAGARGGVRTRTVSRSGGFKPPASASSATRAGRCTRRRRSVAVDAGEHLLVDEVGVRPGGGRCSRG